MISGVTLWGAGLLVSINPAAAERGSGRVGGDAVTTVSLHASAPLTGPDGFTSSADAATVARPNQLRPMVAEIAALQTSASAGDPVWGDVSSITVAAVGCDGDAQFVLLFFFSGGGGKVGGV